MGWTISNDTKSVCQKLLISGVWTAHRNSNLILKIHSGQCHPIRDPKLIWIEFSSLSSVMCISRDAIGIFLTQFELVIILWWNIRSKSPKHETFYRSGWCVCRRKTRKYLRNEHFGDEWENRRFILLPSIMSPRTESGTRHAVHMQATQQQQYCDQQNSLR